MPQEWSTQISLLAEEIRVAAASEAPPLPPPAATPAHPDGTEGGACYGNGTCNDDLTCASNLCVRLPAPAPAAPDVGG